MNQSVPFTDLAAMTRDIRPAADRAWANLLDSSQFVGGDAVEEFERAWASDCGVPEAVGVEQRHRCPAAHAHGAGDRRRR